mgnify:CR=1 FL=1
MWFTFVLWLAVALASGADQTARARPSDAKALVETFFEQDAWSSAGQKKQAEILGQLAAEPALDAKSAKKWTAKCLELATKGARLEKKSGRHFLWEKPDKGLYLVSGETANPKGLLVAMHGGGAGSGDATTAEGAFSGAASKLDWLMICPEVLEKTEHGWTDSGSEEFVLQLVERALRTWKIDRDKVFFAGHSMGGYGTWLLGAHHADLVAGLAPSAGAPTPITGPSGAVEDIVEGVIPNLRNVRIAIYQSDDDPRVPPIANRVAAKKLDEAAARWGGYPHEYWEVPGRQHEECPGGMPALLAKIAKETRAARPAKIVWQPTLAWKRQFYWLYWPEPKRNALVEAELDREHNTVTVRCDADVTGLEILLDDELLDPARDVVVKLGDQEVFRGRVSPSLATIAKTALTGDAARTFTSSIVLRR